MNAKLIDLARIVLQRHADKIADAANLAMTAEEPKARYAGAAPVAPLAADNGRQSGGLVLRARDNEATGEPVAADTAAAAAPVAAAKPGAAGKIA